jgi:hypothetical protein
MKISDIARNAFDAALTALIDGGGGAGKIQIYTGSPPANTTDGASGTLLSTMTFSATSFGTPATGVTTANTITSDASVAATGTAGYYRIKDHANVCIGQGIVGLSGADLNLDSLSFILAGTCAITSATITMPAGS